eukprot:gene3257-2239_t
MLQELYTSTIRNRNTSSPPKLSLLETIIKYQTTIHKSMHQKLNNITHQLFNKCNRIGYVETHKSNVLKHSTLRHQGAQVSTITQSQHTCLCLQDSEKHYVSEVTYTKLQHVNLHKQRYPTTPNSNLTNSYNEPNSSHTSQSNQNQIPPTNLPQNQQLTISKINANRRQIRPTYVSFIKKHQIIHYYSTLSNQQISRNKPQHIPPQTRKQKVAYI